MDKKTSKQIEPHLQHNTIQQFAHEEIRRLRYIVPFGEKLQDIVCNLGYLSRAYVINKRSRRQDRQGEPGCKNHMDIRIPAIRELEASQSELFQIYRSLTSRAILFSLETSRSRILGATERLQLRKVFLPAFKAPPKRDVPIKIDNIKELKSLLSNPQTFCERELKKSDINPDQLSLALEGSIFKSKEL